jgi:hypothetical protein
MRSQGKLVLRAQRKNKEERHGCPRLEASAAEASPLLSSPPGAEVVDAAPPPEGFPVEQSRTIGVTLELCWVRSACPSTLPLGLLARLLTRLALALTERSQTTRLSSTSMGLHRSIFPLVSSLVLGAGCLGCAGQLYLMEAWPARVAGGALKLLIGAYGLTGLVGVGLAFLGCKVFP